MNYTSAVFSIENKISSPTVASVKSNHSPVDILSQNEIELKSLKEKLSSGKKDISTTAKTTTITKPTEKGN